MVPTPSLTPMPPRCSVNFSGRARKEEHRLNRQIERVLRQNPGIQATLLSINDVAYDGDGFVRAKVREWLDQFDTTDDKHLALKMLEKMDFLTPARMRNGSRELHRQLIEDFGIDVGKARFITQGNAKSSGLMNYYYRQANGLGEDQHLALGDLDDIRPDADFDTIVILEDVVVSGSDASKRLKEHLETLACYDRVFYLSLVGYRQGMELLSEQFPNVRFIALHEPIKSLAPARVLS